MPKKLEVFLTQQHSYSDVKAYVDNYLTSQRDCEGMYLIDLFLSNTMASMLDECEQSIYKNIILQTIMDFYIDNWKEALQKFFLLELHLAEISREIICHDKKQAKICFLSKIQENATKIKILNRYPMLEAKLKNTARQYKQFIIQFIHRFHQDKKELILFLDPETTADISQIEISRILPMSDSHHDGQKTVIVELRCNSVQKRIVYKPKCFKMDQAILHFYTWVNKYLQIPLAHPTILVKSGYFWSEYITHIPATSKEQMIRYYIRFGYLVGLGYLLNANDLHHENLIAHGEHPIIIDTECLVSPNISGENEVKTDDCSLSISGLLSCVVEKMDISALFGKVNFDNFESLEITHNRLIFEGKIVNPFDYKQSIIDGFTEFYNVILREKKFLLTAANSPLHYFKPAKVRVVFRGTPIYYRLLQGAYYPTVLASEMDYLEHLGWIKQNKFVGYDIDDHEIKHLINDEIPYFYCHADKKSLYDADHCLLPFELYASGYDRLIEHLHNNFSPLDLQQEVSVIHNAFELMSLNLHRSNQRLKNNIITHDTNNLHIHCLEIADKLLQNIYENMKTRQDGFIFWHRLSTTTEDKLELNRTNFTLYDGLAGIGLTFVYGAKIFNNTIYIDVVKRILAWCTRWIEHIGKRDNHSLLGVFDGYCGIVYFLHHVVENLPELNATAILNTSIQILIKHIHLQHRSMLLDVISGTAGILAVWSRLKKYISESDYQTTLQLLLNNVIQKTSQLNSPDSFNSGQTLLGFAHGVSGMVCIMQSIYVDKPSPWISNWIEQALSYERKFFDLGNCNWPLLHSHSLPRTSEKKMSCWCHGAVGIGISRAYIYSLNWNDAIIPYEIAMMQKYLNKDYLPENVNLCHGMLGNLELSILMKQQGWYADEHHSRLLEQIIHHIPNDLNILCEYSAHISNFGLMTGKSGVAYQMMRAVEPTVVPSVLLLL